MLAEMMGTNEPEGAATLSSAELMLAELSVSNERPIAPSPHRASSALVVGGVTSDLAEQLLQVCPKLGEPFREQFLYTPIL
jgi:hypothetical protein